MKAEGADPTDLREQFGDIDVYLFDQLLKGRLKPGMSVLEAGCGSGRNLVYLLRSGFDVFGIDGSSEAVDAVRRLAAELAPRLPADNFRVESVESMSFADASFDGVISNAVLHFASDEDHFQAMLREMWRVLRSGGIFFCRLASTIGIEGQVRHVDGRRYRLPDGDERFLVDASMLSAATEALRGTMIEPLKTVIVQDRRSMTTWCLQKST